MIEVAVIAFEGISLFHLSVPIAIFEDAALNDNKLFKVTVCAESAGHLRSANGLAFDSQSDISAIETADVIILPSWDPSMPPSQELQNYLNEASNNNKMIVGLCVGAYALAYSGLLNGKRATTHWKYAEDFATRFPHVTCDTNPLYITEGNVITSAGSAAAIDCCLHLVKHFYGVKVANKIARVMVSSPERTGGQNQYIETPTIERPSDERIALLIDTIIENIAEDYTLESAAECCMMSVRSFSRHFKAANGISFTAWLINTRLNYSVELLESTNLSILEIAEKAGFSSEQIFRKHFKQRYDTNPMAWRKLFNGAGE